MKKFFYVLMVIALFVMVYGCEKEILNTDPSDHNPGSVIRKQVANDEQFNVEDGSSFNAADQQANDQGEDVTKCLIMPVLPDWPTWYFVMNYIEINNDRLIVNVSYSGGSRTHDFKLVSTDFDESIPVQVTAEIFHFTNGDNFDGWVTETREFDLTPLKTLYIEYYNEPRGRIIINLNNVFTTKEATPLVYEFFDDALLPPGPPLPPQHQPLGDEE
jgi:hypothetical protein